MLWHNKVLVLTRLCAAIVRKLRGFVKFWCFYYIWWVSIGGQHSTVVMAVLKKRKKAGAFSQNLCPVKIEARLNVPTQHPLYPWVVAGKNNSPCRGESVRPGFGELKNKVASRNWNLWGTGKNKAFGIHKIIRLRFVYYYFNTLTFK